MGMQQGNHVRSPRIPVVDDQEARRKFMVRLLEAFGMETIETDSGADVLLAVQSEHPDLVLPDPGIVAAFGRRAGVSWRASKHFQGTMKAMIRQY